MLGSVAPLDEEKVYVQLLTKRPYSIMVSAKSPWHSEKRSVLRNWPNQHFITYDKQYVHVAAMRSYFAYAHIKPTVAVYKVPDISWVKELVRENVGIALMVRDAAKMRRASCHWRLTTHCQNGSISHWQFAMATSLVMKSSTL